MTKVFDGHTAVDDLTLEIPRSSFFALLGPSGCGKTTSLRMIGGFEDPTAGRVELGGVDVTDVPPYKRDVNTVFQSYALFPHLDVSATSPSGSSASGSPRPRSASGWRTSSTSCTCRASAAGARPSSPAASSSASRWRARS